MIVNMNTQCSGSTCTTHAPAKAMWHLMIGRRRGQLFCNTFLVWYMGLGNSCLLNNILKECNSHSFFGESHFSIAVCELNKAPDLKFYCPFVFWLPLQSSEEEWLGTARSGSGNGRAGAVAAEWKAHSECHVLVNWPKGLSILDRKYAVGFWISGFGFVLLIISLWILCLFSIWYILWIY